ncbi:CAP family protein [Haliangium sp. UPWRP_2]|uniref:CAP family protein n=1 Tax=Haliangium sp. UPWRP_2 TaxID=1931276 RepID=UPI000B53FE6B|nr:CAP family protein [Haliangium sp. UPWRP_2]PSM31125.1 secretion protein [Haliangium sp. UPWRP_2]
MNYRRGIFAAAVWLGTLAGSREAAAESIDMAAFRSAVLAKHNDYRARHHAPKLEYSSRLESGALSWARRLASTGKFEHSGGEEGENLHFFFSTESISADELAEQAVSHWYNEIKKYNYKRPGFSGTTGHFTQVVWKSSTSLGCGAAKSKDQSYFIVCRYSPAGNVLGKFPENVDRPSGGGRR